MNKRLFSIFFLLLTIPFFAVFSAENGNPPIYEGQPAPTFSLLNLQGERIFIRDYCGDLRQRWKNPHTYPVVLNFYTTFCRPCGVEIQQLHQLANKYGTQAKFFLIAVGEPEEKVKNHADSLHYTLPILIDRYQVVSALFGDPQIVPKLVLIDPDGIIRFFKTGYDESNIDKLDELLKEMTDNN